MGERGGVNSSSSFKETGHCEQSCFLQGKTVVILHYH